MLHQMPADELGHVRKEIQALRAREIELRKCFTDECDDGVFEGCEYDVEVKYRKRRVLARNRLPSDILNDPKYFDIRLAPVVRVVKRKEQRLPLGFGPAGMIAAQDNFDVVEAWN
ncbi:hypothetical protein [Profundibacter amoris]|uniref:Uncharacterized protein n=1 Tax=Profundibacter amoris TaxID=2171755 RepID=A0A347UF82_9RHOB|nr:hypothetical protein [Profundibacter amoris]AXX97510.1 hypothetical protein BAR1_05910 [Profundibacter amoris]